MANPFAKYAQPQQEEENPFAKYAAPKAPAPQPEEENPFAKYAPAPAPAPAEPAPAQAKSTVVNPFDPIATPEEKGFFSRNIDWAADSLRSGWENLLSGVEGLKQSEAAEYVARLEEKYGPGAVNAPPDKQQVYKEAVQLAEQSRAERQRIAEQQQQRYIQTPQREATRQFKAAITGFEEDELGFLDSAAKAGGALLSNPIGVITDLGLESTPASIAMLASAILVRFGGGGALAAAGTGGATSAVTEFGNEYAARRDKGIPHDQAWSDAAQKSGVIGLLDAVSMNSAGKAAGVVMEALTGTRRIGKAAVEVAKETGKQAALGAAGEAGGSLFIGEMPNPAAVMAEAVGEVFGAPLEAVGTYRSLKPKPESREDAAMRGLDAIADEEEKARVAERAAAETTEAAPAARTLDSLTQQEVDAVQRRLYAELGRPAEEQELLEGLNDYIAEQNAGLGVKSGTSVAGVSGAGAEQPAGATGVSDTGVAATPATGGLDVSGVPTDQLEAGTTEQFGALDEAYDAFIEADDVRIDAQAEMQRLRSAVEELGYEGTPQEQEELNKMLTEAEARYEEARLAADAAYNDYQQLSTESIELTEGIPSTEEVEAAAPKAEEVITETPPKPVFALPEGYAHGTDYLTSQKIIREGRLAPDAGKRMYSYSQFGRKAVYLTARDGWWLDSDKAAAGRAVSYEASVPFKLDPKANIREVNTKAELDAIAREIGEKDSGQMMRKLNVDNLDEEQAAKEIKNLSFEDFVNRQVTRERKLLQKYEAPGADSVVDIASWAAREKKEDEETGRAEIFGQEDVAKYERRILGNLRSQYNRLQNFEAQFREADKVTRKLLDAGIDGIYVGPNFEQITQEERQAFDKVYDEAAARMPNADPRDVFNAAVDEYSKINPTYFERVENTVASDQLALFRPELAVVDRARLAATKPGKPSLATVSELPRVDSIERFPLGPTSIKPKVIAENQPLYRETSASGADDLLRDDPQFSYAPIFVTDNPDIALGQRGNVGVMVEFRPNSVSGEISPKPVPGELTGKEYKADVIAPKAVQRITFDNAKILNSLSGLAKRTLAQKFNKKVLPNGKIEFVRKEAAGPSLSPDTVGEYTKQPGETIEEYQERLVTGPKSKLAPHIIELISNNDLTGALNAIAAKFSVGNQIRAFYGDLASRLAELNLPTEIRIGDARNLTRRGIDNITSAQQVRLFAYLRTAQPAIFDKYFKEYYKDSALELVYTGLIELNDPKYKKMLGPVENEFNDVLEAYDDYMPGMPYGSLGAYYPNFDIINLSENGGLNYHTFLHEVVHAATEILLRTPINERTPEQNAAIEELQKLYDLAKNNIKVKEYGLTNLSEFIAEVYTNFRFRNLLKGIPYAPAKTNVLTRFIQSIMKLVGMDNVAGRAMIEAEKLFNVERPLGLTSAGPRFMAGKKRRRQGTFTTGWRTAEDVASKVLASRPEWKDSLNIVRDRIWDPMFAKGRAIKLGAAELRHLSDMAGNKFPLIGAAVRIIEKMISHRGKVMTDAAAITKDWMALQKKNLQKSKLLGKLMVEATVSGVEVDPTNTKYYDATKVDPRVKDAWNALGPEFQNIYRRVRDFYQKQMQDSIQIMRDRANLIVDQVQRQKMLDNIDRDFGPDKLIYPYFPLKRFGQYWFQVGPQQKGSHYKEFYTFESIGERNTALRNRKKELEAGNAMQRALAEKIEHGDNISTLLTQVSDVSNVLKTVNELIDSLPDKFKPDLQNQEAVQDTIIDVQKELRDDINQLLYTLMPEQSMRKQMISRKQVQGASSDMLRVFANSATRIAYQQARAKYSPQYIANLNNARSFINDMKEVTTPEQRRVYRDFLHEMERRYKPMLGMEDTSILATAAGVLSDAVTVFMMSAPMSAFLQTVGFFQFTATQLGGRYGYAKATDRMWENFKTYSGSTVQRTLVPLKNGQMMSVHFPSAMESGKLTGIDKVAALQLIGEEQVNVSQTYDMVNVGDSPSDLSLSKYVAFKRAAFMPLHQIERFNREIGLLTTFQLEYEKLMSEPIRDSSGVITRDAKGNPLKYQNDATTPDGVPYSTEAYDRALTHAKDTVAITLGETTRQMRPRYFMNAVLALPLKFKRYMITALYSMWRNFDRGFMEPFSTVEVEQMRKALEANKEPPDVIDRKIKEMEEFRAEMSKEGRSALAGIMFNTFLMGGVAALPFYTTIFPLIVGMFISDDDDDEFFDFDNWYRNYMEKEFGGFMSGIFSSAGMDPSTARKLGRDIGEALVVGPATKLTGGSLSERVSLDIKSMAFRDMRYTQNARETMLEIIAMVLGPVAGLALTESEAYELYKKGQYGRMFEKGLPAIISKPITATRYALEDAKTKRGDELVSDVTGTEIALQAIGLTPYRVAKAQRQAIQVVQKVQKIENKRNDLMNDLWMANSTGDIDGFNNAWQKAIKFSTMYPTYRITPELVADSFKKRAKEQAMANAFGARVDKKSLPIAMPMLQDKD